MIPVVGFLGLVLAMSGVIVAGVALVRGASSRRWIWTSGALIGLAALCFVVWAAANRS